MKKILFHLKSLLTLLTLVTLISLVTASAQVASQGGMPTAQQGAAQQDQDNDTTRGELASFDQFMDRHPEIAEQLRKDPSLVKNEDFVRNHRDLQEYLQKHPGVSEEISENPARFMHQEQRFDRAEEQRNNYRPDPDNDRRDNDRRDNDKRDNDTTRGELASFDQFMDRHPEIAEQLRKDPSLVKNEDFVRYHRDLQEYLQQHPGVSEEISENPDRFMRQEQRFDRHEDRDHGMAGGESAVFGQFLGSHSSIAQDLSRNPSLANDEEYLKNHPDFQQYLQTHPGVQAQLKQNPQVFMKSVQPLGTSPATVLKTPTVEPKAPTIDPMPKQ
jgi:small nuclear ribonucleoprotein (snRNP)-like protein